MTESIKDSFKHKNGMIDGPGEHYHVISKVLPGSVPARQALGARRKAPLLSQILDLELVLGTHFGWVRNTGDGAQLRNVDFYICRGSVEGKFRDSQYFHCASWSCDLIET